MPKAHSKIFPAGFMQILVTVFTMLVVSPAFCNMGGILFGVPLTMPTTHERLQRVCKYDKFCLLVLNVDGTLVKPKPEVVDTVDVLRKEIKSVGKLYGVDPRAIAGAIIAENSLNVTMASPLKDWLVKMQIAKTGMLWKPMSLGLGQIHEQSAAEVEGLAAKTEGRQVRSPNEIAKALLTPAGSIHYIAAIMKAAQIQYAKNGYDIKDNPGILTTIFNINSLATNGTLRATNDAENHRKPRINYFGYFVRKYMSQINLALAGKAYDNGEIEAASKTEQYSIVKQITLVSFPPQCVQDIAGKATEYNKYSTWVASPNEQAEKPGATFRVIEPGMDCMMRPWSLIQTSDGKFGWVENETLRASMKRIYTSKNLNCRTNSSCLDEVKARMGKNFLGEEKKGVYAVRLAPSKKDPSEVNYKTFTEDCLRKAYSSATFMSGTQSQASKDKSAKIVTPHEARAIYNMFEKKKSELKKYLRIHNWYSQNNYLVNAFQWASDIESCSEGKDNCEVKNFDDIQRILNTNFETVSSFADLKNKLIMGLSISVQSLKTNPTKQESLNDQVSEIQKACPDLDLLPRTDNVFKPLLPYLDTKKIIPGVDRSVVKPVIDACRLMEAWKASRSKSHHRREMAARYCPACTMEVNVKYNVVGTGYSITSVTLTLAALEKYFQKISDFDKPLKILMSNFVDTSQYALMSSPSQQTCKYDPFASERRAQKLLNMPCVAAVLVPDPYLLNKLGSKPSDKGRVFSMIFPTYDRFAFVMKPNCSTEGAQ